MTMHTLSLRSEFQPAADVLIPNLDGLKDRLRRQMTINMDAQRELAGDWFGQIGPRLRLFRNWVMARWKRTGPVFYVSGA